MVNVILTSVFGRKILGSGFLLILGLWGLHGFMAPEIAPNHTYQVLHVYLLSYAYLSLLIFIQVACTPAIAWVYVQVRLFYLKLVTTDETSFKRMPKLPVLYFRTFLKTNWRRKRTSWRHHDCKWPMTDADGGVRDSSPHHNALTQEAPTNNK